MASSIYRCAICGFDGANVFYEKKSFCKECVELFGTCKTCIRRSQCGFNDDPMPLPKIVTNHVRHQTEHGYVEQIVQMPNPQRIQATCIEGECVCCNHDLEKPRCMRQFGICAKYEEFEF